MAVGTYALTSLSNLKSWLGITASTDDAVLERAIDRATSRIESYLERNIKERSYAEWRSGAGVDTIRLHQWPVTTVTSVFSGNIAVMVIGAKGNNLRASIAVNQETPTPAVVATYTDIAGATTATSIPFATYPTVSDVAAQIGATGAYNATVTKNLRAVQMRPRAGADCVLASMTLYGADTPSEFTYDYERGRLTIDRSWFAYWPLQKGIMPNVAKSILIEYTAGYATVPDDIEQACIEVSSMLYRDRRRDGNLQSEGLGDYNYSRATVAEMNAKLDSLLERWKEIN
jgi:hypothetical protein